jgi:cation diffusion facilitator CzcD-associated flavoprotein CzcO
MAGFPNLFMITGPQSPGVKSQMILACEQHVDWITDCVQYLRDDGFSRIEAEEDAEDAWVQHNNEVADRTLPVGELMVRRRQYPREAPCLHAVCWRRGCIQKEM